VVVGKEQKWERDNGRGLDSDKGSGSQPQAQQVVRRNLENSYDCAHQFVASFSARSFFLKFHLI
jgi:hypothetical protein